MYQGLITKTESLSFTTRRSNNTSREEHLQTPEREALLAPHEINGACRGLIHFEDELNNRA